MNMKQIVLTILIAGLTQWDTTIALPNEVLPSEHAVSNDSISIEDFYVADDGLANETRTSPKQITKPTPSLETTTTNTTTDDGGLSKTTVIVISTCVPIGVLGIAAAAVVFIIYKRKIWCFKTAAADDTSNNKIKLSNAIVTLKNLLAAHRDVLKEQYRELEKRNQSKWRTPGPSSRNERFKRIRIQGNEFFLSDAMFKQGSQSYLSSLWENNVCFVIMLTRVERHGQLLCERYWPEGKEEFKLGGLSVRMVTEMKYPDYVYRKLSATWLPRRQDIHHYQYTNWHLAECPDDPKPLLNFINKVRNEIDNHPNPGPVVVHCSEDFARTGCYVVLDQIIHEIQTQKTHFSVYNSLLRLKEEYPRIAISEQQYFFIHLCLKMYLELNTQGTYDVVYEPDPVEPYAVVDVPPTVQEGPQSRRTLTRDSEVPPLPPRDYRQSADYQSRRQLQYKHNRPHEPQPAVYEDMRPVVKLVHQKVMARDRAGRRRHTSGDSSDTDEGVYDGSQDSGPSMKTIGNQWI